MSSWRRSGSLRRSGVSSMNANLSYLGKKTSTEAQVATLNGEVDLLSQQVQDLATKKATLVERLALQGTELATEASRRKVLETDLS